MPGAEEVGYLTNETLFQLTTQPRRLAILGGGPIGSEMAQTFARLGTAVTILDHNAQILNREDADAARIVQEAFVQDGIQLIFNATITALRKSNTGKVIEYEQGGMAKECEADEILVSIGRVPNLEGLDLAKADVAFTEPWADGRRDVADD